MKNIINYIIGTYRKRVYRSRFKFLIRKKIIDQVHSRLGAAREECINEGKCQECGCKTPDVFFAPKACPGGCYPKMK